ncbi:TPA: hypothetical protein ACWWAQ_001853 [Enterococcus faecium]|uniref:hypothetical protein n=1 Tax=Enterococcus faecium TaxID=1352 RepID=UPI0035CC6A63
MKNALLTISLIANVALGGMLVYTSTEIGKLDDQRENMRIANEQLERKLQSEGVGTAGTTEEANSTAEAPEASTSTTQEASTSTEEANSQPTYFTMYHCKYYFDGFGGRIAEREGVSQMQENATVSPVTVSMVGGGVYNNAFLYTNRKDKGATVVVDGQTVLTGRYEYDNTATP